MIRLRRKWILFSSIGTGVVLAGSIWRNNRLYPNKSLAWKGTKSTIDVFLILLTALKLPRLLIAWVSYWITKPIKNNVTRVTIGIFVGLCLDFLSGGFLEALILLGLFSIDLVTGKEGFLGYVDKYEREDRAKKAA